MSNSRFTMNALLVIVIIFSAIGLFFTVGIYDMGQHVYLVTDRQEIEGTDLSIKYSTKEPSGIYRGPQNGEELVIEGDFGGNEEGIALCGDKLYLNEFTFTSAGLTLNDVVMADLNSCEKTLILENASIRGRCASGELVCIGDCLPEADKPAVNSLCRLYAMTSPQLEPGSDAATIYFIDPESGKPIYSTGYDNSMSDKEFNAKWLSRTLGEVRK